MMTNKLLTKIAVGLMVMLVFWSCRDEDFPALEAPVAKAELIQGTWAVSGVFLNDEEITNARLSSNDGSITPLGGFAITFTNGGYSINDGGLPSPVATESGNWAFNDDSFPTAIAFDGDAATADLVTVPVTGTDNFTFEFTTGCGANVYRYVLTRQ